MDDLLRSVLFYGAGLAVLLGLCALVYPIPAVMYRTRVRAFIVVIGAGVTMVILSSTPPRAVGVASPTTELDRFAPAFQFREVHETRIDAPPDRVYAAIKSVTPDEIALFHTFTWIRRFGQSGPASILNAPGRQSILDTAVRSGFMLLSEQTNREIVFGSLVIRPRGLTRAQTATADGYRMLDVAGVAKATMNFLLEPTGTKNTRLLTETRIFATDDTSLQIFTPYWLAIYPGSAILRVAWLRAIKTRAEGHDAF